MSKINKPDYIILEMAVYNVIQQIVNNQNK